MQRIFFFVFCFLLVLTSLPRAHAAVGDWQTGEYHKVRLISGTVEEQNVWVGVEFELAEGWKIYWRTPGDGGLPTEINFSESQNTEVINQLWPAPMRDVEYGEIEAFGYKKHVIFPFLMKFKEGNAPLSLKANLSFAICKELCLFEKPSISLAVPPKSTDAESSAAITEALKTIPQSNGEEGLKISSIALSSFSKEGGAIKVTATSDKGFSEPDLFIESNSHYRFPKPSSHLSSDKKTVEFIAPFENTLSDGPINEYELTLTLVDDGGAVELKTQLSPPVFSWKHYAFILLMAYLGGLILNIMPCVLPVLSLKLLGVIKHSGGHFKEIRLSFLSSTLGIITSFMLLAALVTVLQSVGVAVGWGFQFQSPLFITTMVLILSFFAANLFGFFEIHMPAWAGSLAARVGGHKGRLGHFGTGVLATLLATPCSAPLLGTAIGFAFSQSTGDIFVIFGVMGIGLATPYILFSLFPHMVSALPKPGAWMLHVKHVLGALLLITSFWLVFVISSQIGFAGAAWLGVTALLILAVFASLKLKRNTAIGVALLLIASAFANPLSGDSKGASTDAFWKPFEEEKIMALVEEGQIVFVDVTADWCLTCKANKLLVLDRIEVVELLKAPNVYPMKADWTNRNEDIATFLMKHGRYGIPFNIVFGPGAPEGIALPELLSVSDVKDAVKKAKKSD